MTAEADFLADPVGFMNDNILRVFIHGFANPIQTFKFTLDDDIVVKRGSMHWWKKSLNYYKVEPDPAGAVRAYVLGYRDNQAVGAILGVNPGDPSIMFTYRMDGCSLGYSQASAAAAAYVSHHNDIANRNVPANIVAQGINFADGSNPVQNYAHKAVYMTDSSGGFNEAYKSTTVGVRDGTGIWRFYMQVRKWHGTVPDKDLSLKRVIAINP